jgi:VWFA-related protein
MAARRWIAVISLIAVAVTTPAQQLPPFRESLEVSIVNVDVFVTDKDGNRVRGLTQNDFEIYENGKLQPISNFAEYLSASEQAPPAAAAADEATPPIRRTIAVFLEKLRLPEDRANEFIGGLKSLIGNTIRAGDAVAIMTWDGQLQMRVPYTSDIAKLGGALEQIRREMTGATADYYTQYRRDVVEMTQFMQDVSRELSEQTGARPIDPQVAGVHAAQLHANIAMIDMKRKVSAIKAVVNSMAAAHGKKILLLGAHHFPQYAGAEYFYAAGQDTPTPGVKNKLDTTWLVKGLIENANAGGVTIYPLLVRGLDNTAGALDPATTILPDNRLGNQILMNDLVMIQEVAKKTGGLAAWDTRNIAGLIPRIEDDVTDYYSLAYRARVKNQDRTREVVVKTKNPALTVRSRREFVEKSDVSRMRDRVLATLFGVTETPTFAIAAGARRKPNARGRATIPVRVRIPIKDLTLMQQADHHVGRFSVFVATGEPRGDASAITQRTQPVQIAARDLERARAGYYTYTLDVTVDDRADRVAIGVLDETSKDFALIRVPIRTQVAAARR